MREHLFFALQPDASAVTQIMQVGHDLRTNYPLSTTGIPAERLHVTLFFVGGFDDGVPPLVLDSAGAIANSIDASEFDLSFDKILSFRSSTAEHPVVLSSNSPMSELHLFRYKLANKLRINGFKADKMSFTPHITLAYEQCDIPEQAGASHVEWTAREFVLIKSLYGKGQYEVLGRWPLGAKK